MEKHLECVFRIIYSLDCMKISVIGEGREEKIEIITSQGVITFR